MSLTAIATWFLTHKYARWIAIGAVLLVLFLIYRERLKAEGAKAAIEAVNKAAAKLKAKADAVPTNETDDTIDDLDSGRF